jgi:hypothetical protein
MVGGGAGACALRPCHIGMSRSAERRHRLRRSAGGGGGESCRPPRSAEPSRKEGASGRARAARAEKAPARASEKKERKKTNASQGGKASDRPGERARENSRQVKERGRRLGLPARRPEGAVTAPGRETARRPLPPRSNRVTLPTENRRELAGARAEAPTGGGGGDGGGCTLGAGAGRWGGSAAPARGLARYRAPASRATGARLGTSPRLAAARVNPWGA